MNKPVVAYQWGFTEVNMKKSNFLWKINNYSHISKDTGVILESPLFSLDADDETKWYLGLYANGYNNSNYVSLYFMNKSSIDFQAEAEVTLSMLDANGVKCSKKKIKKELTKGSVNSVGFDWYVEKSYLKHEAYNLIVNDVLTIFCEYTIITDIVNSTMQGLQSPKLLEQKALEAFERQFESDEFHDFTLTAPCGKQLRAHKFVLAARSPVFSSMIIRDMKEKNENNANIKEVDYASLREMLRFMYSAKVENLKELAGGVLEAARKYQVDGLKEVCEEYLFKNLTVENAVETLALAYRYEIENLKAQASKFITFHAKEIIETPEFQSVDEANLLSEIIRVIASNK
ncbi:speckle-type POZ protein-like [Nasonia vitripennis]|uniref:Uncharacterized protein n=1 Tax=Nasonia vitripennis TaxID=7425 RepID=A0A7M7IPT6_NASVI|nr:speckle-type POZ protein-like [Nasonia vitripennis]